MQKAIDLLQKAEDVLLTKLKNSPFMKTWNKALQKVYLVFIEAYSRMGDDLLKTEYENKSHFHLL